MATAEQQRRWREKFKKSALRWFFKKIKHAAKIRNKEFDFTLEDAQKLLDERPTFCPVIPGIRLVYTVGHSGGDHAELDRIDNEKGYVRGNIRFISKRANRLKSDAEPLELFYLWQDAKRIHSLSEPEAEAF